jgi:hypothetical protein
VGSLINRCTAVGNDDRAVAEVDRFPGSALDGDVRRQAREEQRVDLADSRERFEIRAVKRRETTVRDHGVARLGEQRVDDLCAFLAVDRRPRRADAGGQEFVVDEELRRSRPEAHPRVDHREPGLPGAVQDRAGALHHPGGLGHRMERCAEPAIGADDVDEPVKGKHGGRGTVELHEVSIRVPVGQGRSLRGPGPARGTDRVRQPDRAVPGDPGDTRWRWTTPA